MDDNSERFWRGVEHLSKSKDELLAEIACLESLVGRQADILTRVANALKGPPPPLVLHSHHDLGEIAEAKVAEVDRLQRELNRALAHAEVRSEDPEAFDEAIKCRDGWVRKALADRDAEIKRLHASLGEAQSIIAGCAAPPTDDEIVAHEAAGGEWIGFRADGEPWQRGADVVSFTYSEEHERAARRCVRWWPLDANGRPCAWPKVTP